MENLWRNSPANARFPQAGDFSTEMGKFSTALQHTWASGNRMLFALLGDAVDGRSEEGVELDEIFNLLA